MPEPAAVATVVPPPLSPAPTELPPAHGERLLIQQTSCVYPCPTYQLEVYANGRVRWEGTFFVSVIGERVFSIDTDLARAFFERWRQIDLEFVPRTYSEATRHEHVTPRRALYVSADGVETERYEATFLSVDEVQGGPRGLGTMAAALDEIGEAVGLPGLIKQPRCWGFYMGSSGAAELGDRSAADVAAKWYFEHPDFFVIRIVVLDRPRALQAAMELRQALFALGVPAKAVWLRRLPAPPRSERLGWGWVAAATPRCFGELDATAAD